jgi:hypothetical protein
VRESNTQKEWALAITKRKKELIIVEKGTQHSISHLENLASLFLEKKNTKTKSRPHSFSQKSSKTKEKKVKKDFLHFSL